MNSGNPRHRAWARIFVLAAMLWAVVLGLSAIPVVREFELRLADTYFQLAPVPAKPSPVVLVLIDDESLRLYGRWPWSRDLLAQITQRLADAGAQTIGLDILLAEPQSANADQSLQQALAAFGHAVIVDKIGEGRDGPRWIEPIPQFAKVAAIGHAQAVLDRDGVCRQFPPYLLSPDGPRWAFAMEVARRANPGATEAFLRAYSIPVGESGGAVTIARPLLVAIPFRRDPFTTLSAAAVMRGMDLTAVRGRPVLIGFGPTEISDRVSTPLTGQLPAPGVEVHAQILDAVLTGRKLYPMPLWQSLLLLAVICVLLVSVYRVWRGWGAIAVIASLGAGLYGLGYVIFVTTAHVLPPGFFLLAAALAPLMVYSADLIAVEHSLTHQFQELGGWLASQRQTSLPRASSMAGRLALLQELQVRLGSMYELHSTLLEATQDLVAIFDAAGNLLLRNQQFEKCFHLGSKGAVTLQELLSRLQLEAPRAHVGFEGEAHIADELYSVRIAPMPPTTLAPSGGTMVTLTSLRTRVERDRARAEALGFLTHELRTPLAAIQSFAELMMRYPGSPTCAEAPETIYRESKRLLALIGSYLDVLRLDAGARSIRSEPVDLDALVRRVFDIVQPLADAANMRLDCEPAPPVTISGDSALLTGALLNLVSNAIKYGDPGTEIRVRSTAGDGFLAISVHNFGKQIPGEDLPRVFESYHRAADFEAAETGWGLGLAFVKRIAEKHGGRVRAKSGGGETIFEILLPAETRAAATSARGNAS
jgi:CHASE2 domain-containing sensor protein/signal transduction histidine kinase